MTLKSLQLEENINLERNVKRFASFRDFRLLLLVLRYERKERTLRKSSDHEYEK